MTSLSEGIQRSEMICMLAVPAKMTCIELMQFVAPSEWVNWLHWQEVYHVSCIPRNLKSKRKLSKRVTHTWRCFPACEIHFMIQTLIFSDCWITCNSLFLLFSIKYNLVCLFMLNLLESHQDPFTTSVNNTHKFRFREFIECVKIIRDATPNQYMVLVKFRSQVMCGDT